MEFKMSCPVSTSDGQLSRRATTRLAEIRAEHAWVRSDATTVMVEPSGRSRWWTFAGRRANLWLASLVASLRVHVTGIDDLGIALDEGSDGRQVADALAATAWPDGVTLADWISDDAIRHLKFADCIPRPLALAEIEARLRDDRTVASVLTLPVVASHRSIGR